MTKKQSKSVKTLISQEYIESKILHVRGKKVMLDLDLTELYGVTTGNLNKAVNRDPIRFPGEFMIQLNKSETESLRFQIGISKKPARGGRRYPPNIFTQEGIAMLSSVHNSKRAVLVNIQIMRAFVKLRELMGSHRDLAEKINRLERKFKRHDKNFVIVFEAIKKILDPPVNAKEPMGFHSTKRRAKKC